MSKLTKEQVKEVLRDRIKGHSIGIIAEKFGVSRQAVSHICLGVYWKKDSEIACLINAAKAANTKKTKIKRGESHPQAKLSAKQVADIFRRREKGETYASIAKDLNVSATQIRKICVGEKWKPPMQ